MKRLLLTALCLVQPALAAEDALMECRQIAEIAERVACYDTVVDARFPGGRSDRSDSPEPPAPPESAKPAPAPDAQSLFGRNDAETRRIVETTLAIEQVDRIVATTTDVRQSASRKLTVTLDNGQVWRQLDQQRLHLKTGDTVEIRKASLGSFLMKKQTGRRSIRVKRAN